MPAKTNKVVDFLENLCVDLKSYISRYTFKSKNEEINFFKNIKPKILSRLIYYRQVYCIQIMCPYDSDRGKVKYYKEELDKLKSFFDRNLEFYKYYRSGCCHLDQYYFVRGIKDIQLSFDLFYFERDPNFSTSHDCLISKILANELLPAYLNKQISELDNQKVNEEIFMTPKLTWTGKK